MLYYSSREGKVKFVKLLLEHCAYINDQGNNAKSTPLHAASFYNHFEVVNILLEEGANPTLRNIHNLTPINEGKDPEIRKLFEKWQYSNNEESEKLFNNKFLNNVSILKYASRED